MRQAEELDGVMAIAHCRGSRSEVALIFRSISPVQRRCTTVCSAGHSEIAPEDSRKLRDVPAAAAIGLFSTQVLDLLEVQGKALGVGEKGAASLPLMLGQRSGQPTTASLGHSYDYRIAGCLQREAETVAMDQNGAVAMAVAVN